MPLPRLEPTQAPPKLDQDPVQTGIPIPAAIDRALQESTALNDMEQFLPSLEGNMQTSSFLLETTKRLYQEISSTSLQSAFVQEVNQAKTPEEVAQITSRYESTIKKQTADIRTLSYLNFLKSVPSDLYSQDAYDRYQVEFETPESIQELRIGTTQSDLDEMRHIVNEYVADKSFSGFREATEEVVKATFLPFQETLINSIVQEAGVPLSNGDMAMAGFGRQEIRDYLVSLSAVERKEVVQNIINAIKEKEGDPIWGQLLADFSIIDFTESVLSDDTLQGRETTNTADTWVTNVVTALDALWLTGIAAKGVRGASKGLASMFANRASRASARAAGGVSTPAARDIVATLRNDPQIAEALHITPEERLAAQLPVPEDMLDDIKVVPEEITNIQPELAARREQINALVARNPRTWLAEGQKQDIMTQELMSLSNAARGVVRITSSSTVPYEDGTGFRINALIGASEVSGWKGSPGLTDVLQIMQTYDTTKVGVELLVKKTDGTLESVYQASRTAEALKYLPHFEMEIARNAGLTPNSEFFIRVTQDRLWTPEENVLFGDNPVLRSGVFVDILDAPNYRFSPEVYNTTLQGISVEQSVAAQLNEMLTPVWNLSDADKRFVFSTYRWTNEFAQRTGRNPKLADYKAAFPDMTDEQATALYAMRYTQDTWFQQLNARLYRNWQGQGYVTGVSTNDTLPRWHGKRLPEETIREGEVFYDPALKAARALNAEEIRSLYNNDGGIIQIDLPIGLPNSPRTLFTKIIVSKDNGYTIEALHRNVLDYHPGYFPNLNEDSFLIVKRYESINIDGVERSVKQSNKDSPEFSVAIRTADSLGRARKLVDQFNRRRGSKPKGYTYDVVTVKDLSVQERSAQLNHLLNRQGRMFYDKRDYRVLRNLDGNPTELADPVHSMERVIGGISRQLGMEDTMRSLKVKFKNQYPELITENEWRTLNSKEVRDRLISQRNNTTDPRLKKRIQDALSLWNHIRMLDGVDSDLFGSLRAWALDKASVLNSPMIDKAIINMAPMQIARSAAFKAFMVTRPVRQALLQSMQILFLAPIDPIYVGTGKILTDGFALRIGVSKLKGLDTDWSNAALAKVMGMTKSEYNTLIKQVDMSGLLHHVDVHAFAGGSRQYKKMPLPKTRLGSIGQVPLKVGSYVMEKLQSVGFDLGERNNLAFTYLLAFRRKMRATKAKSLNSLTTKDWDDIRNDASNLAFGMLRNNQFTYQSGTLALTTQFLSFSHKAALAMLGRNPALKGMDLLKIWAGSIVLFGSGMFGANEFVEAWLDKQPGAEGLHPATRENLVRMLSSGLVDVITNNTGRALVKDWKDLDLSGFAPGPGNLGRFYGTLIEAATEGGALPLFLGPAYSLSGNLMTGMGTAITLYKGDPDMSEADKFLTAANEIIRNGVPGYGDLNAAYDAWVLNDWYSKSGQNADVRATYNTLIAKGLLAVNSDEMNAYWRIRGDELARKDAIRDRVQVDKARMQRIINLYGDGVETLEGMIQAAIMIGNITSTLPEEDQLLYYRMMNNVEFGEFSMNQYIGELVAQGYFDKGMLNNVEKLKAISEQDKEALRTYIQRFEAELGEVNQYREEQTEEFEAEQKNAN